MNYLHPVVLLLQSTNVIQINRTELLRLLVGIFWECLLLLSLELSCWDVPDESSTSLTDLDDDNASALATTIRTLLFWKCNPDLWYW